MSKELEALYDLKSCLQAYYTMKNVPNIDSNLNIIETALERLEKYNQIEKELVIDLITMFSQKYEHNWDMCVKKDKNGEKIIYFCGDSYYGDWTKEQWLNFIEEVISTYRELVKLGC